MSILVAGDTLITSKRFLESALTLSEEAPRPLLSPLLSKNTSFAVSLAFLIECIVLHERLFCTFSEDIFRTLVLNSKLARLLTLLRPLPYQSLVLELERQGNIDKGNIELGYERINNSPSLLLDRECLPLFKETFPKLATEDMPKDKPQTVKCGPSLRDAYGRHFRHYETKASLAIGISYSLEGHEAGLEETRSAKTLSEQSGYKIYGDKTLKDTKKAAEAEAKQLNSWIKKDYFSVQAPLVFSYVVQKANGKDDLLSVALDVRETKEAISFRKQCAQFDQAMKEGNDSTVIEMIREIEEIIAQLGKRIKGPKLKFDISIPPSITFSPTEAIEYFNLRRKRHLLFISHLYEAAIRSGDIYSKVSELL